MLMIPAVPIYLVPMPYLDSIYWALLRQPSFLGHNSKSPKDNILQYSDELLLFNLYLHI